MYELLSVDHIGGLVAHSAAAFDRHGVEFAFPSAALPHPPAALESAIADGYTDAVLMPPATWQQAHRAQLIGGFAGGDDATHPYVEVGDVTPQGRPDDAPYLLMLRPDPLSDADLRGLTAPALRKALGDACCLTVEEYLVVQRLMAERFGDHRFDDYSGDPSGWMWLADSTDGTVTAMGYWNGAKGRVEVTACKTGSKNPRKGARRCRVVPLASR